MHTRQSTSHLFGLIGMRIFEEEFRDEKGDERYGKGIMARLPKEPTAVYWERLHEDQPFPISLLLLILPRVFPDVVRKNFAYAQLVALCQAVVCC